MQNLGEPRVMSIYEFASALGLAHQTIRTWAHEGRIATVKLGRRRGGA
jgi:excisionase family DNA binding protein